MGTGSRRKSSPPRLVTRAALARTKGVSRGAVTRACADGGPLHDAMHGRFVDLDDPLVVAWLAEPVRGPDSTTPEGDTPPGSTVVAPTKAEMLALTKRKREEEIRRLKLANDVLEAKVISREFVHTHVFGAIDGMFRRFLSDLPQTTAAKIMHATRVGEGLETCKRIAQDANSAAIKSLKSEVQRKLEGARTQHQELIQDAQRAQREAARSTRRRSRTRRP